MKFRLLLIFILLIQSSILSIAQQYDSDTLSLKKLDEIIIQENRISIPVSESNRSLTVITKKQLEELPYESLSDVLSSVAGIDIRSRGSAGVQGDVSIRGSSFDENLVLVNGIKLTDPQTGHHLMNLPFSYHDIERIEILKGAAARIYGQNAYAGAINIVTKSPDRDSFQFNSYGGIGITDSKKDTLYYSLGMGISGNINTNKLNQYLSVSKHISNGYQFNSNHSILNLFSTTSFNLSKTTKTKMQLGYSSREFGANGFYAGNMEYEVVNTGFGSLDFESKLRDGQIKSRIYFRSNKDNYKYNYVHPEWFHNVHLTNSYGAEANYIRPNKYGLFGIGIELRNESIKGIEEEQLATNPLLSDDSRKNAGLYVEQHIEKGKFQATPGIYLNQHEVYGTSIYPGIDMGYDLTNNLRVFMMAGRSYRVPTFFDLYYSSDAALTYGDPKLTIGKANTYEIGIKYSNSVLKIHGNGFYIDAHNTIDWVNDSTNPTVKWQAMNFDNVNKWGIESSIEYSPASNNFLEKFAISYTYIKSSLQDDQFRSRYALANLRHHISGSWITKFSQHLFHSISLKYFDRPLYSDTDIINGEIGSNKYLLLDTRMYLKYKNIDYYIQGNNITNTNYLEVGNNRQPGFWISFGVNKKI